MVVVGDKYIICGVTISAVELRTECTELFQHQGPTASEKKLIFTKFGGIWPIRTITLFHIRDLRLFNNLSLLLLPELFIES